MMERRCLFRHVDTGDDRTRLSDSGSSPYCLPICQRDTSSKTYNPEVIQPPFTASNSRRLLRWFAIDQGSSGLGSPRYDRSG